MGVSHLLIYGHACKFLLELWSSKGGRPQRQKQILLTFSPSHHKPATPPIPQPIPFPPPSPPPPSPPPSPPNYTRLWIRIFSSLHDFPLWPEMWRITQKKSCARLFNVHYPQDGAARHDDMAVWRRRRCITARKMADAWRQNGGKILCAPRYNGLRRRCWGGGRGS